MSPRDKRPTMHNRFDNIEEKLDKLDSRLDNIDITLAKNTLSLEIHEKRTTALEARVEQVRQEMIPVEKHVTQLRGGVKIVSWIIGTLIAIGTLVFSALKLFK